MIDQVGPGGHFMGEAHTLRHYRENWYPKLYDYVTHGGGGQPPGKSLYNLNVQRWRQHLEMWTR